MVLELANSTYAIRDGYVGVARWGGGVIVDVLPLAVTLFSSKGRNQNTCPINLQK
jgi:hypothetical protein